MFVRGGAAVMMLACLLALSPLSAGRAVELAPHRALYELSYRANV